MQGQRYGKLVVVKPIKVPAGNSGRLRTDWVCACDCGVIDVVVEKSKLVHGRKIDCGCGKIARYRQGAIKRGATYEKHRMVGTRTYYSWAGMKARCQTLSNTRYNDYGGRGIKLCERWQDFRNFLADMGERPEGKTLDRKDVNGNYELSNCRWADKFEQAANKRKVN